MHTRNEAVIEAEYRQALLGMNTLYEKLLVTQRTALTSPELDRLKERIRLREADVLSLARELRSMHQRQPSASRTAKAVLSRSVA